MSSPVSIFANGPSTVSMRLSPPRRVRTPDTSPCCKPIMRCTSTLCTDGYTAPEPWSGCGVVHDEESHVPKFVTASLHATPCQLNIDHGKPEPTRSFTCRQAPPCCNSPSETHPSCGRRYWDCAFPAQTLRLYTTIYASRLTTISWCPHCRRTLQSPSSHEGAPQEDGGFLP